MADEQEKAPEFELDEEAKALLLAQKKAEARKAIAEATATLVPKVGSVADTLSLGEKGGTSVASVEASRGAKLAAADIVKAVGALPDVTVVMIVEDRSVAQSDIGLTEVRSRLETFETAFAELEGALPQEDDGDARFLGVPAIPALLGLATLVTGFIGLLKSDYAVSSRDVTADKLGLIAEVAEGLRAKGRRVVLPGFALVSDSPIITKFRELLVRRYHLERRLGKLDTTAVAPKTRELDALRARLGKLQEAADTYFADGKDDPYAKTQTLITQVSAQIAEKDADPNLNSGRTSVAYGKGLVAAFDAAATAISSAPATGYAPLIAAALREKCKSAVGQGARAHLLYVEVSSAGADVVTRSNSLFRGARAAFLGAAGATYFIADSDGALLRSGTTHRMSTSVYDFADLKAQAASTWGD